MGDDKWSEGLGWEEVLLIVMGILGSALGVFAAVSGAKLSWAHPVYDSLLVGLIGVLTAYLGRAGWKSNRSLRIGGNILVDRQTAGAREQYDYARDLLRGRATEIFLMQRSSTLILGPQANWDKEKTFYAMLMEKLQHEAIGFYPVVSLEGIKAHLSRAHGDFDKTAEALPRLKRDSHRKIFVQGKNKPHYLKWIDDSAEAHKQDKHARVMLVGREGGTADAIIALNLAGDQSIFHLRGAEMNECLKLCKNFYIDKCRELTVHDLSQALDRPVRELEKLIPESP